MTECFPPIPVYIVTGIILAMFTTVTSKIESGERDKIHAGFALLLLGILMIPYATLLIGLGFTLYDPTLHCPGDRCNRWAVGAHAVTISPLIPGAFIWFRACKLHSLRNEVRMMMDNRKR